MAEKWAGREGMETDREGSQNHQKGCRQANREREREGKTDKGRKNKVRRKTK